MKFRPDFVTNSSRSSYLITLRIVDTDDTEIEFEGNIDEASGGYFSRGGEEDPRKLAAASSKTKSKQYFANTRKEEI